MSEPCHPEDDESARIGAWLELEGLPADFPVTAHPGDEMMRSIAAQPTTRPGSARLTYLRSGQEVIAVLEHALRAHGRSLAPPTRVLELASGFGRVTRHLLLLADPRLCAACEIVPAAVEHVGKTFCVTSFLSRTDPDAIDWPQRFDVVFVASLFSHLPRPRFAAWLQALRRALTPDGVLVFSTHGRALPIAPAPDGSAFAFVPISESALDLSEYGSTFVTPEETARLARAAGFADVRWLERELWSLQDLFIAAAGPLRAASPWTPAPVLEGAIDGIESSTAGDLWLHGWVASRDLRRPVSAARLHFGEVSEPVVLHAPQAEEQIVPVAHRRVKSEWHIHVRLPADRGGRRPVALVATADGVRGVVDVRTLDLDRRRIDDGG